MNSKDILKNALLQYTGTLIVVSHDRDFLSGLTDELYEFRDGAVHEFKGDIMEFLEAQSTQNAQATQAIQNAQSTQKAPTAGKAAYEQSKERERERRKLQNAVKQKEQEIEAIEAEIAAKDAILATGEAQSADFYKAYQSLKDQLEQKMSEWEEAVIAAEE
jgi:ATP-binding cassette subfamily F protein 3